MEQRRDSLGAGVRKDDVYYFEHPPRVLSYASCVGKKEGEGPLGDRFDVVGSDDHFGQETWEQAEKVMVQTSLQGAVQKVRLDPGEVGCVLGATCSTSVCLPAMPSGISTAVFSACTGPVPPWPSRSF